MNIRPLFGGFDYEAVGRVHARATEWVGTLWGWQALDAQPFGIAYFAHTQGNHRISQEAGD